MCVVTKLCYKLMVYKWMRVSEVKESIALLQLLNGLTEVVQLLHEVLFYSSGSVTNWSSTVRLLITSPSVTGPSPAGLSPLGLRLLGGPGFGVKFLGGITLCRVSTRFVGVVPTEKLLSILTIRCVITIML